MRYAKLVFSLLVVLMMLAFTFSAAIAQGETPDVQPDASYPVPTFPTDDFLMVKKPIFKFTIDPVALNYQIKVWNYYTEDVLYTIKGKHCEPTYCFLQATTDLKTAVRSLKNGYYAWSVRSKHEDGWKPWSDPAYFVVLSKGFTSTFTAPDSKWSPLLGTWKVTDAGYLKTNGTFEVMSSNAEKHLFSSLGLVYEIRMRRKNESNTPNGIIFLGDLDPLATDGSWETGYIFKYQNSGQWGLSMYTGGTLHGIAGAFSSAITPDWNKLTVWRVGDEISVWINETFLGTYPNSAYYFGYVGVGMVESSPSDPSPLLVDWAKVYYSANPPYAK